MHTVAAWAVEDFKPQAGWLSLLRPCATVSREVGAEQSPGSQWQMATSHLPSLLAWLSCCERPPTCRSIKGIDSFNAYIHTGNLQHIINLAGVWIFASDKCIIIESSFTSEMKIESSTQF